MYFVFIMCMHVYMLADFSEEDIGNINDGKIQG